VRALVEVARDSTRIHVVALGVLGGGLATTGDIQLRFDNVVVTAE